MVEVPGVADRQQEDANISMTGAESKRSVHSTQMALLVYRIRTNNTLLTDQLTTQMGQRWFVTGDGRGENPTQTAGFLENDKFSIPPGG